MSVGSRAINRSFGEKNGLFKLPPWKNVNKKRDEWAWAADVYDDYVKNGWDWYTRGKGRHFLESRYGVSQGPARTMIKRFRAGWIPLDDPEWLEEFKPD